MRKYSILMLSALVALWAAGAYAEVQNVKVSGKLEVKGVYRNAYVVQGQAPSSAGYDEDAADEAGDIFMTTTELKVQADLTDNVSTTVLLRDEREFGGNAVDNVYAAAAYAELKEFLYAPVSLKAGFWKYELGSQLILGDGTPDSASNLTFKDLNKKAAFDGIVVDYALDNGNVEVGYLRPRGLTDSREGDIYVVDTNFDLKGAAIELYYVYDGTDVEANNDDARQYIGGRVTGEIMEGLTGALEVAYLFGDYGENDYDAMAIDASLNYVVDAEKNASVGLAVLYRSGDKDPSAGDYEAWYAPYNDQDIGEIVDFDSNILALKLSGAVDVMEDVTLSADFYHFWADEDVAYGSVDKDDDLGNELDVYLTWDYTSDVQFGLTVAAFWPGDCYEKDDTALEVLGSMTVNF